MTKETMEAVQDLERVRSMRGTLEILTDDPATFLDLERGDMRRMLRQWEQRLMSKITIRAKRKDSGQLELKEPKK